MANHSSVSEAVRRRWHYVWDFWLLPPRLAVMVTRLHRHELKFLRAENVRLQHVVNQLETENHQLHAQLRGQ